MLPDNWQSYLDAALEELQKHVNDELDRQYRQLVESLRDLLYELFNYPLERPWPDTLAIFAEYWTDRGLKLTPRTLDAIGQLIAEELDELEDVYEADSIDASAAADAAQTATKNDDGEVTGPDIAEAHANASDDLAPVAAEEFDLSLSNTAFGKIFRGFADLISTVRENMSAFADDELLKATIQNYLATLSPEERQEYVWKGAEFAANYYGIPTTLLTSVKKSGIPIKRIGASSDTPGFRPGFLGLSPAIYLFRVDLVQYARLGAFGNIVESDPAVNPAGLFNELFHAYYWLKGEQGFRWLKGITRHQTQFETNRDDKAQEAMSETIQQLVQAIAKKEKILTYDEILARGPNDDWYRNLTPQHVKTWPNDPTINEPMSETLYYATVWVLYNGNKDPYVPRPTSHLAYGDNIPGQLAELKRFFAKTFRPQWSPEKVDKFVKGQ